MRKIERRMLGIDKVVEEIENNLISYALIYEVWIRMSEESRKEMKRKFKRSIKRELLGEDFSKALCKDCLSEGEIKVESEVFKYVKRRVYKGNLREMLGDLKVILDNEKDTERRERRWKRL